MAIAYSGMCGTISLGFDLMSKNVRKELGLSDKVDTINLVTCSARQSDNPGYAEKLSPMVLVPVLARTRARRQRYGVSYQNRP